jgi:hypothetical protein
MQPFPESVCQAIGNYVYRLIDPRNGETFYVGKGKNNRVFDHINSKIIDAEDDEGLEPKLERIRLIRNEGLEVIHVIHRHNLADDVVLEVEAALIDAYPGLTNLQAGHGSNAKGPMNHQQLMAKYALPSLDEDIEEKLVLININAIDDQSNISAIYDQVRYAWRISKDRACQADYVLAVVRGVVKGVFVADEWFEASRENFPDLDRAQNDISGRYGFRGRAAPNDIWNRFVGTTGKRITNEKMMHFQNPIRYWKV